jgi:hypothetical protein
MRMQVSPSDCDIAPDWMCGPYSSAIRAGAAS